MKKCLINAQVLCCIQTCVTEFESCPILKRSGQTFLTPHEFKVKEEVKRTMPIDFNEQPKDFDIPLISTIELGTAIEIVSVKFSESQFGEYALITAREHGVLRTGNMVMLKQLHQVQELIDKKRDTVIVTLKKTKRYYHF